MRRAMVKPKPKKPGHSLAELLELFGFDRAYTILNEEDGVYTMMFEGDQHPTIIDLRGEKPELKAS